MALYGPLATNADAHFASSGSHHALAASSKPLNCRGKSMDETKQKEPEYSKERVEQASVVSLTEATHTAESSRTEEIGRIAKQEQDRQMANLLEIARRGRSSPLAEFAELLKRNRRGLLKVAAAICGIVAMVILVKDVTAWARNVRERRLEEAVASVTPDRLIARCGQPAEDTTKEVYPIVMRTMSYQPRDNEKFVVAFSKTAEEKSDWVFLSMKDVETRSYDTPQAKAAALPCLNSKK
jgi:hypothetical protein